MNLKAISPLLQTYRPLDIFVKVIDFNAKTQHQDQRATVRISLASGFMLEGIPVSMDKDGNAVLTTECKSIGYIEGNQITGIELLNPGVLIDILTDGRYFDVDNYEIPTMLELKRTFEKKGIGFEKLYGFSLVSDWPAVGLKSAVEKYQFKQLLDILTETLLAIAQDEMGRVALNELNSIELRPSEKTFSINLMEGQLELAINLKNKFTERFQSELQTLIESNL